MTFDSTPGSPTANSFAAVAYADDYWSTRLSTIWDNVTSKESALINATRAITKALTARREYIKPTTGIHGRDAYFLVHSTWTGAPATTTQKLPWPRIGMFDRNGNVIPVNVIPDDLKDLTSELAGQMSISDRMLENNTVAKGIRSLKAGPVDIVYSGDATMVRLLPEIVWTMLVPSWITEEYESPARRAFIAVTSN